MTSLDSDSTAPSIDFRACRVLYLDLPPEAPAKRIVHELDGIDHPVDPARLLDTGHALWKAWLRGHHHVMPDVLLGLGTSSIVPTIAVAIASGLPYHLTWKLDLDLPDEPLTPSSGTHRTEVLTYGYLQGKRVLIVDDEVIHGHTVTSLISILRDQAADVVGVLCLVEDTVGTGRKQVESAGVPLCALSKL